MLPIFILFLLTVCAVHLCHQIAPKLPLPALQLFAGMTLGLGATWLSIPIPTPGELQICLPWVLVPFLLIEGQKLHQLTTQIPGNGLPHLRTSLLSIGLTLGVSGLIGYYLMGLPVLIALALGAMLIPTDTWLMAELRPNHLLPPYLRQKLHCESLIRGTLGITLVESLRVWLAQTAPITLQSSLQFILAIGGASGLAFGAAYLLCQTQRRPQQPALRLMLQLGVGLMLYALTQLLHFSTLTAVLLFACLLAYHQPKLAQGDQHVYQTALQTLSQSLNGFLFQVIGFQTIYLALHLPEAHFWDVVALVSIAICLYLVLTLGRFGIAMLLAPDQHRRYAGIYAVSGVRSALTLLLTFTLLPTIMANAAFLPQAPHLFFVVLVVIVVSTLLPTPLLALLRPETQPIQTTADYRDTHWAMMQKSVAFIQDLNVSLYLKHHLFETLKSQLQYTQGTDTPKQAATQAVAKLTLQILNQQKQQPQTFTSNYLTMLQKKWHQTYQTYPRQLSPVLAGRIKAKQAPLLSVRHELEHGLNAHLAQLTETPNTSIEYQVATYAASLDVLVQLDEPTFAPNEDTDTVLELLLTMLDQQITFLETLKHQETIDTRLYQQLHAAIMQQQQAILTPVLP